MPHQAHVEFYIFEYAAFNHIYIYVIFYKILNPNDSSLLTNNLA